MYKSTESEHLQLSFFQFNASCGMQLDCNNEWIRDANRLPWKVWESQYSAIFSTTTGNVAKPSRMVIGSLIIQQRMGFTDRELVKQIQENPYYQYFIGNESSARNSCSRTKRERREFPTSPIPNHYFFIIVIHNAQPSPAKLKMLYRQGG